ncbi:MAG: hypothetical protein Rhirs2KO_13760 [Rhizobiaceae bacterium]
MDGYQFVASVVESLAWPAAIAVVAVIFRGQLNALASRVEEVSFPGGGAKFKEQFAQLTEAADEVGVIASDGNAEIAGPDDASDPYFELATKFPEAAVIRSYKELELHLQALYASEKASQPRQSFVRFVMSDERLNSELRRLFKELAETRNAAVHASNRSITTGEAIVYRQLAQQFISRTQQLVGD